MPKRTELHCHHYPRPVEVKVANTYAALRASRPATPSKKSGYNLHIRCKSAIKVRELAALCGTTNAEVLDAMIEFAYDRAMLTGYDPDGTPQATVVFMDTGRTLKHDTQGLL